MAASAYSGARLGAAAALVCSVLCALCSVCDAIGGSGSCVVQFESLLPDPPLVRPQPANVANSPPVVLQFDQVAEAAGVSMLNGQLMTAPNCLFGEQLEVRDAPNAKEELRRLLLFADHVPDDARLDYSRAFGDQAAEDGGIQCIAERFAGGAAAGDYDGDGWMDLAVTRLQEPPLLYRNKGDGTFEDVSTSSGLHAELIRAAKERDCLESPPITQSKSKCRYGSGGLAWADVDNDGHIDLYVTSMGGHRNYLFMNNGDGTFSEQALMRNAQAVATDDVSYTSSLSVSAGDFDRDGYLDLFVGEWRPFYYRELMAQDIGYISNSRLLRNRGVEAPGHFEDVTEQAGLNIVDTTLEKLRRLYMPRHSGLKKFPNGVYSFAPMWTDMDNDGWLDLWIAGDFSTSLLFWNNRNGTFTESSQASGVDHEDNGMGAAVGDIDQDGWLDMLIGAIYADQQVDDSSTFGMTGNFFYRNLHNRSFEDLTQPMGLSDCRWGWGVSFLDIDNDGDEDLYCVNGFQLPETTFEDHWNLTPDRLWVNTRNSTRDVWPSVAASFGLNGMKPGRGISVFDYDHDGDQDIFVVNYADTPYLFRNHANNEPFVRVRVLESPNGRDSIGARVYVGSQMREISSSGLQGHNEPVAHFGAKPYESLGHTSVRVWWPHTEQQVIIDTVALNSLVVVVRPESGNASHSSLGACAEAAALQPRKPASTIIGELFGPPMPVPAAITSKKAQIDAAGSQQDAEDAALLMLESAVLYEVLEAELKFPVDEEPPIDGKANHDGLGAWNSRLGRISPANYGDGISRPADAHDDRPLPGPRYISNALGAQGGNVYSARGLSDCHAHFGQLLAHDTDHTPTEGNIHVASKASILIPTGDPVFDPEGTGTKLMRFRRSVYDRDTGVNASVPRQQLNRVTAFIDASVVYGSVKERAAAVRVMHGGKLATSSDGELPFNTRGMSNDNPLARPIQKLYLAGDVRVNIQLGLMAMHALFVREHNFITDLLLELLEGNKAFAAMSEAQQDEVLYRHARRVVVAELQAITWNGYLPAVLGRSWMDEHVPAYTGYKADVDPSVTSEFSTSAFRFGHSQAGQTFLMVNEDGSRNSTLSLKTTYFHPDALAKHGGIDAAIRGMVNVPAQEIDMMVMDDLRNFLFGTVEEGAVDLLAINIMRGRDHGVPPLNDVREHLGLTRHSSFDKLTSNSTLRIGLPKLYGSVDDVDLFVGGLCEDHIAGGSVGETFATILTDQFIRLRDGDKFWYQNVYDASTAESIEQLSLSNIIRRNVPGTFDLHADVFFVPGSQ